VYKLLLCWRYLLTRYLALACIVSVMLGVATLIVVNSVMGGFSKKLKDRLHGLLSDVIVESRSFEGFPDPEGKMAMIRSDPYLNERIEAMTATLEIFAMLQYTFRGETFTRPVHLIGIDPEGRARIGGFSEFLVKQKDSDHPSFELGAEGRERQRLQQLPRIRFQEPLELPLEGEKPPPEPPPSRPFVPQGIIIGNAIASIRLKQAHADTEVKDFYLLLPGDEATITTVSGARLAPVSARFVVVDYIKTEMSEYDANYVFVPLDYLQQIRTMEDRVTSIQIRLKNYDDAEEVVKHLETLFPEQQNFQVSTWQKKQGPLLGAIAIEKGLLNVLLFLIIAVAGFGILAIFSMIVTEKTRDIGILKALGASNGGVMKIFMGYGLLLGLIGAGLGTALGLALTININRIEKFLSHLTGNDIFPRDIYYFDSIPTDIQAGSVILVNLGAILIAVLFSVLPALRAALLHPVRALRYE
jgi:lipoprotein-releasing system permease protein